MHAYNSDIEILDFIFYFGFAADTKIKVSNICL